jgi:hypothetical protein
MKEKLILLLFIPILCISQETSVENMLNAFNNIDQFKKKLFKDFPLDPNFTSEDIILENYKYTIYKTQNEDLPFILIANEAISIGMYNDLFIEYYEEFYKYLNEHCNVTMKQTQKVDLYDEWECDSCFWRIKPLSTDKSGVFFLKRKD